MSGSITGLYAITANADERVCANVEAVLQGGARIIQYRDKLHTRYQKLKIAADLKSLCDQYNALFIINDDIQLVLEVDANGVHIGKKDAQIATARKLLGSKILGVSCYNEIERAVEAQRLGADYVAFGRFYPSATKPEAVQAPLGLLTAARARLHIPIVAIGGITLANASNLIHSGADAVAVINGLFAQKDLKMIAQQFAELFNDNPLKETAEG